MRRLEFVVTQDYDNHKVVHFLRGAAHCSAAQVKRLKAYDDGILVNGVHARTIDKLHTGDRVCVTLREDEGARTPAPRGGVAVLYEDDDLVVFDKPAGMPCHQSRGHFDDTPANAFSALMLSRGQAAPFRAVNRLDRDTTGAVAAAKSAYSACLLTGRLHKRYVAIIPGELSPRSGAIELPIYRPDSRDIRRCVDPRGQYARTDYETLRVFAAADGKTYSIVRCRLPTGRTHQIRVHMAHLGHPLCGDTLYGGQCAYMERQALHCAELTVDILGCEPFTISSPMPKDMQKFAEILSGSY